MDKYDDHFFPEYVEVDNKVVNEPDKIQETTDNNDLIKEIQELKLMIKELTNTLGG